MPFGSEFMLQRAGVSLFAELSLLAGWYVFVALGVTVGYHRVLTHRAAIVSRPVLYALVFAGLAAGPPALWVAAHRRHHKEADSPGDPHCPSRAGFWFAHAGWYLGIRSPFLSAAYAFSGPLHFVVDAALKPMAAGAHGPGAPDVLSDPVLRFWSTRLGFAMFGSLHLLPVAGLVWLHSGVGLVVAFALCVGMYNVGDLVNSALHLWGEQPFETGDSSRNAAWLALSTFGESWHNGHHAFPSSAKHGLLPGQLDLSYAFLCALHAVGLARELKLPSAQAIAAKRRESIAPPGVRNRSASGDGRAHELAGTSQTDP